MNEELAWKILDADEALRERGRALPVGETLTVEYAMIVRAQIVVTR